MEKSINFLKRILLNGCTIILAIVIFIFGFIVMNTVQQWLLVADDFDIWFMISPWSSGIFIIEMCLIEFVIDKLWKRRIKDSNDDDELEFREKVVRQFKKYRKVNMTIIAITLYVVFINVAWVKGEQIFLRSTLRPLGKSYSINDIVQIDTGFYSNNVPLIHSKGEFYYIITLEDGKKINLNKMGAEGSHYGDDTYLSIEEIDSRIMNSNTDVIKNSSYDNSKYAYLDDIYMDRFKRIIENK